MDDPVECHSDYTYAQRPTAVYWREERLGIEEILNEWRSPNARHFKVVTANGLIFELSYQEDSGQWRINPLFGEV
jgi:hypothetical protein